MIQEETETLNVLDDLFGTSFLLAREIFSIFDRHLPASDRILQRDQHKARAIER